MDDPAVQRLDHASTAAAQAAAHRLPIWREIAERDDLMVAPGEFEQRLACLTQTELVILSLMAHGLMNKQIAYRCGAAQSTIKSHVTHILRKLRTRSRTTAAVQYAVFVERLRAPVRE
ncbi:helix-turn-helix transcriptional regulator [uncultured Alsobacter sp.]|uniref:helix-turn-helix domain-containing protein n=1 Tax=uncultured Alsobacter sp. TaxID=1748258 RepID=UPI0025F49BAE|nr:helix-turn-helix transcriptional regulator [uncultured Alsobacter sp.]